jgi:hypothetical protein
VSNPYKIVNIRIHIYISNWFNCCIHCFSLPHNSLSSDISLLTSLKLSLGKMVTARKALLAFQNMYKYARSKLVTAVVLEGCSSMEKLKLNWVNDEDSQSYYRRYFLSRNISEIYNRRTIYFGNFWKTFLLMTISFNNLFKNRYFLAKANLTCKWQLDWRPRRLMNALME